MSATATTIRQRPSSPGSMARSKMPPRNREASSSCSTSRPSRGLATASPTRAWSTSPRPARRKRGCRVPIALHGCEQSVRIVWVRETDISIVDAVLGSDLYRQCVRLREAVLRRPLGLTIAREELADDTPRQHFCALSYGAVVGSVSLKPLDESTLQLKQMAVAEERRGEGVGAHLLAHAEAWGSSGGFFLMVLNARIALEGFYARYGYQALGKPFQENTVPHIRMTKRLRPWEERR